MAEMGTSSHCLTAIPSTKADPFDCFVDDVKRIPFVYTTYNSIESLDLPLTRLGHESDVDVCDNGEVICSRANEGCPPFIFYV